MSILGQSLRNKFVALAVCVAVSAIAPISVYIFLSTWERGYETARQDLTAASQNYAFRIQQAFDALEKDAGILGTLPQVLEILNEIETKDDTSRLTVHPTSKARLEAVFSSFMVQRPHYAQMRLLTRKNDWQEVVRVNQAAGKIQTVASTDLQSKGHRDYIQRISQAGSEEFYYSKISLNQELGQIEGPAMVRLVRLIRTSGGQINAVLIINVEVKSLLGSTVPAMRNGVRLLALTSDLDYFLIDEDAAADSVVLHTEERWQRLPEMEAASFSDQFVSIDQGEEALAMPILALEERENRPFSIQTISSIDRAYITEQLRLRFFWIGVFLLLSLFLSWFLAQRFAENILAPLKKLHQRIIDRPDQGLPIEIEISSGDEVGELAAAFQEMSESLVAETLRVRAMFSAVDNAIVVIDQDGIIEEFNPAASQIFGYEAQEIVGKKLETLMPKSDAENHQGYVRNFDGQSRIMSEQRNITGVRKDGSHVYLEISVNKVTYAGKDHVIGLARDVSQRVKAQNKVETLISALKRSNEELDQFAYMASHDLRAPLRVIENASKWLEEDLEEHLTEETREILDLLKSRASRMDKMLQDLLEHSRIGKSDIDTQNIRGDELMSGIMQLLDVPAGCKIHVSDAFKGVQIPQMPIETVLLNLISNAIKHHDHDECEINVDVIDRGDVFEFSIQDDGPGIPVQFQEKVFEIFHTLKPRDEVESSGMGLAMVRKHVDVIGGTIDLISDGVRGTTFRISWPKRRPQSDHGLSLKAS